MVLVMRNVLAKCTTYDTNATVVTATSTDRSMGPKAPAFMARPKNAPAIDPNAFIALPHANALMAIAWFRDPSATRTYQP